MNTLLLFYCLILYFHNYILYFKDEKDVSMNTAFIKKLHNGENLPPKEETINNFNAKIDVENIVLHRYVSNIMFYFHIDKIAYG